MQIDSGWTFDNLEALAEKAQAGGASLLVPMEAPETFVTDSNSELRVRNAEVDAPLAMSPDGKLLIVLAGHGDGNHIILEDGTVVCGEVRPMGGPCSADLRRCVRERYAARLVFVRDMPGDVLVLLSCNSLNVAGQYTFGDTRPGIAMTAIRSGFTEVVGTTRQMPVTPEQIEFIRSAWQRGETLGDICHRLNDGYRYGLGGYFVRLGTDVTVSLPELADMSLSDLPRNTLSTERLVSAAFATKLIEAAETQHLQAALGRVRLAAYRGSPPGRERDATANEKLSTLVDATDAAIISLVEQRLISGGSSLAGVGDNLTKAMKWRRAARNRRVISICQFCRGRVYEVEHSDAYEAGVPVMERGCLACGTTTLAPQGVRLLVSTPVKWHAGGTAEIHCQTVDPKARISGNLVIQVRDKSKVGVMYHAIQPGSQLAEQRISVTVPMDAGPDMYSVRIVWISHARVEYHRTVGMIGSRHVDI
ncbi:hypothetical protein FOE78_02755 [Microlunatus elymi]|uniref:CHAT domain-containing protein n=1 Tax=Microlunatus elymi TaxID=2596828 RepID=A0A516PUY9_9ACTN|nr:hypothetical protein [Microlunatus elymi]QDP94979.1 hypothetical protein FOE78_02755 [Microlunatus elymi]